MALLGCAKRRRERDWLMILVAFAHGLRASEVVQLTRDNFHGDRLNVQRLKGSRFTSQPLVEHPEPLLNERQALFAFLAKMQGKRRLFPITRQRFWQIVQEHAEAAGIAPHLRHPHVLKHSIAMQMIGTAGIENTRQYLGHESISSTGEYLEVTDEDASQAARRALEA